MITWEDSIEASIKKAVNEKKLVLMDFFNPQWLGCQQLDAVSWQDEKVIQVVTDWFTPLRINSQKHEDVFKKYGVTWTPTIVVLDAEGKEHYRFTGFLPPQELCARIILDGAKAELNLENHSRAIKCFDEILQKYPGTFAAPEATFYLAVAQYLSSHEPKFLKEGLEQLRKKFADSEWTTRAKPYELIG